MLIRQKRPKKFKNFFICLCITSTVTTSIFSFNFHEIRSHKLLVAAKDISPSIHGKRCTVIARKSLGRLGNVLFEFASAYGLSLEHSCSLYIGRNITDELSQYFEINLPNLLTELELLLIWPIRQLHNHCTYFPKLFRQSRPRHIELDGYWQVQKILC